MAKAKTASANLEFERAAVVRDQIMEVKNGTGLTKIEPSASRLSTRAEPARPDAAVHASEFDACDTLSFSLPKTLR